MRKVFDDIETLKNVEKFERQHDLENTNSKVEFTIAIIVTIIIIAILVSLFLNGGDV